MVAKAEVHYQGMGGTYRKRKCKIDRLWIRNRRDKQLHTTAFPSVFRKSRPVEVDEWGDVLTMLEPSPDLDRNNLLVFIEDDDPFPIPVGDPATLEEKRKLAGILYEESHQENAVIPAARADQMSFLRSLPVTVGAAVVGVLVVITGLIILPEVL